MRWRFFAPYFISHYRVAALDLSGAGDSGHCPRYSPELFAAEVIAVANHAVLVDSAVRPRDFKWERDPRRSPIKPKRVYPTFDEALARFRLMPPQDCSNDYILDYIGRH